MKRAIILSMCLAACISPLSVRAQDVPAQDVRQYTEGPVVEEDLIEVEYGHWEEYVDWLNSTWKPTLEAMKNAGVVTDQPNVILWIVFKNGAAALDNGVEQENVVRDVAIVVRSAACFVFKMLKTQPPECARPGSAPACVATATLTQSRKSTQLLQSARHANVITTAFGKHG